MATDATHAYRGYRLQALYTLHRILHVQETDKLIFQPEGNEDLSVYDEHLNILQEIQIKAYSISLTLSNFEPNKPLSFFNRMARQMKLFPTMKVSLVSFGELGPELYGALSGESNHLENIARKISKKGFVTKEDAISMLSKIFLEIVDEKKLSQEIFAKLSEMFTGVDPENAFDLLSYWLYHCSERKLTITLHDVIDKVNSVGKLLSERASYLQEWNTFIVPVQDCIIYEDLKTKLAEEFYQGVSTRYEHILADLDVLRISKIQDISQKFAEKRVVIIHGASGQGKTTLALRFLKEFFPDKWRFCIRGVENKAHALRIASALYSHANAIGIPLFVYMDVSPHDNEWVELVKQLSLHLNIQVLVTVREEDWKRASVSGYEFSYEEVDLFLDKTEATLLYEQFVGKRRDSFFLNFEEAWHRFGEGGPLLEFVYLLTQGTTLQERLNQQIQRLEREVDTNQINSAVLDLLFMVAIASEYGARLQLRPLIEFMELRAPRRVLGLLEREYLIQINEKQMFVQGLHPVRSGILIEILSSALFKSWSKVAKDCLSLIHHEDVEGFLMHTFSRRRDDVPAILSAIDIYQPKRWATVAGISRALIWLGIVRYIEENADLLDEIYNRWGSAGIFIINFDIAKVAPDLESLLSTIPEHGREEILQFRARQTDTMHVFDLVKKWISSIINTMEEPTSEIDWNGLSFVGLWAGKLNVTNRITSFFSINLLDQAVTELSLETLANVIYGTYVLNAGLLEEWLNDNQEILLTRFRKETFTAKLEDDTQKITIHFVINFKEYNQQSYIISSDTDRTKDYLHEQSILRINLLRKLLPTRETYRSQGYGHRILGMDLPIDSTVKAVKKEYLNNEWLTFVNAIFRRLVLNRYRVQTWQEYVEQIFTIRKSIIFQLKETANILKRYFERRKFKPEQAINMFDFEKLDRLVSIVSNPPKFPTLALDEWGFTEDTERSSDENGDSSSLLQRNLANKKYLLYDKSVRQYMDFFQNYFTQCKDAIIVSLIKGRGKNIDQALKIIAKKGVRDDFAALSTVNLSDAYRVLSSMQQEFRKHFGHLVNQSSLIELEDEEQKVLRSYFPTWFYFTFRPELTMRNALVECERTFEETRRDFLTRLGSELNRFSNTDVRFSFVNYQVPYKGEKALCIIVDQRVANPIPVMEQVYTALCKTLSMHNNLLFQRFTLGIDWNYIVVIPTIKEKRLGNSAWEINFLSMTLNIEYEPDWWCFVPMEISEEVFNELKIPKWEHPVLDISIELGKDIGRLFGLVNHCYDISTLVQIDETIVEEFAIYFQSLFDMTIEILNRIINLASKMIEIIHRSQEEGEKITENNFIAIQLLFQLLNQIESLIETKETLEIHYWLESVTQLLQMTDEILRYCSFFVIGMLNE
ncbi:hypothetical protein JQN58_13810 [Aneurinibacillus sp. BA2021]|nr:hypothetical protein [Aneurinibacillus sp. BA2021]